MLAGVSFAWKSYELRVAEAKPRGNGNGVHVDWGIVFCAASQYIYLVKFFIWEIGYMRTIDIVVDRAGFYIIWGCLVCVPGIYTMHTRFLVLYPSGKDFWTAF